MDQHTIIIGTGNEQFDEMIKRDLEQNEIGQVVSKITTRNILLKRVIETSASMVIVGEDLIGNEGGDEEWELIFEELRNISLQLRIVYICDRDADDLFLARLTTYSIFDIFNEGALPADFIRQLAQPPEFKNIQKFKKNIRKATEDLVQDQREREAENMIKTGVVPQTEQQVIQTTIPVYERLLIPPQLIVIASAYEGAGSSTFARMYVEYLATLRLHVGVLESPFSKPSWFDFIHAKPFIQEMNQWRSWHNQIDQDIPISTGHDITIRDVTYIIRHKSEGYKDWDVMKSAQLVGMARQVPILFYDLSSNIHDERERLILKQANQVYLVTSFDPVRVNREFKRYEQLLNHIEADKITLICNRSSDKLEKDYGKELKTAYHIAKVNFMPYMDTLLEVAMKGDSMWDHLPEDKKKSFSDLFTSMASELLGEEVFNKLRPDLKKQGGALRKLFGLNRQK